MGGPALTERQPYLLSYYIQSSQASDDQFNTLDRGSLLMDKVRFINTF